MVKEKKSITEIKDAVRYDNNRYYSSDRFLKRT